jgi:hypothetical protein
VANGNGKCVDHRAVDIRLSHLEEAQKQIKNMFWAIVVGLFFALVGIYGDLYAKYTGPTATASEIDMTRTSAKEM